MRKISACLQAVNAGRRSDLDDIKRITRVYVMDYLIGPLYGLTGVADSISSFDYVLDALRSNQEDILAENPSPDAAGQKFIQDYRTLVSELNGLQRLKSSPEQFERKLLEAAVKFLAPICDYTDPTDRRCPACPDRNPGATQQTWLKSISPLEEIVLLSEDCFINIRGFKVPRSVLGD